MKKKIISIMMCAVVLIGSAMPAAAAYISALVTGLTATSCQDTHTVAVEWQPVQLYGSF